MSLVCSLVVSKQANKREVRSEEKEVNLVRTRSSSSSSLLRWLSISLDTATLSSATIHRD